MRPALRYHGGKWLLAPWIIEHFPDHKIYVEPYGGGASVLLRKPRSYSEVYNELDGDVVNVFRCLRDHGPELRRRLTLTPFARAGSKGMDLPTTLCGAKTGLRLQPAFALWMMGYPTDWLDLADGEMPRSKAQGTRLSHKSPSKSSKQLKP
jgi:hypothetical protein